MTSRVIMSRLLDAKHGDGDRLDDSLHLPPGKKSMALNIIELISCFFNMHMIRVYTT